MVETLTTTERIGRALAVFSGRWEDEPMANEEHLKILKQGWKVWNQWRDEYPEIHPDMSRANLFMADLSGANLAAASLDGANLQGANLQSADLLVADLSGANLAAANLDGANLWGARLNGADLTGASFIWVDLSSADLAEAILSEAVVGQCTFGSIDLSTVKGLDTVKHLARSTIGVDTIYLSRGNIPEVFLRGAGVPDSFIEYMASLVGKPIEFYSCFISYSSKDQVFAERLHNDLQSEGVRCWFAPEDMRIGDRIRPTIEQSIRSYDKLLIVLSEHSIDSDWVEKEVETAFEEERKRKTTILFPIRLDSAVMDTDQAWAADIRRTRHIGDFTHWKDHDAYQKAFERLLRDLKAEEVVEAAT
jgi:uncharacterized protein YjbI with pentapeptide repeats